MLAIAEEVIQVADEIGASSSQVALAWTRRIDRLIPTWRRGLVNGFA
jgi:aryl-alcohol dehydrogenase-like predicted oxidoreductase